MEINLASNIDYEIISNAINILTKANFLLSKNDIYNELINNRFFNLRAN